MQINENHRDEWRKLVDEQKASGLSNAAFCKEKGIKAERFYYTHNTSRCEVITFRLQEI